MERVYCVGVVLESQVRQAGQAEGAGDENHSGEGVMLKRLSLGGGLTEIRDSPVKGLSWRQYKQARKFIKKHRVWPHIDEEKSQKIFEFHPLAEVLTKENIIGTASLFFPLKHRWVR